MLERLKHLFRGDHDRDGDKREGPNVQGVDRRGTGDENAEHPPTVVARPEEAGHTPDPVVAGGRVLANEPARMAEERRDDWLAGDQAPQDSTYHPEPANRNPARDQARSLEEEAQILADDMIGQKPTTEGTAGHDWQEPPRHP